MKRVALYVRVSTEEQKKHGYSVDSQITALQAFCDENEYEVYKIYNDAGISARKHYTKRPALLEMIEDCKAGRIDLILICKLDRFFRSVSDYYSVMDQIGNVPWKAIQEDYETETSSGVFKVNIMLSVAQSEADRTSERIKTVKQYQKENGIYTGCPAPFGYRVEKGTLVFDEEKKELTRKIFDTYLLTRSMTKTLEMLRENECSRTKNGLYYMLQNPTYKGDAYGHTCDAYLTDEEFAEITRELGTHRIHRKEKTKNVYMFNGLLRCAYCSGNMFGTFSKRTRAGIVKKYNYYRCANHYQANCAEANNISERKIEKKLIEELDKQYNDYIVSVESTLVTAKNNDKLIASLEAKSKRIIELYEDGAITREEYKSKQNKIKTEIESLRLAQAPAKKSIPANWKDIYNELDEEHKKAFWSSIIGTITIGEDIFTIAF